MSTGIKSDGAAAANLAKLGQIVLRKLDELRPAALNDKIYHPVSKSDPAVLALAERIRLRGLLEPIVITTDDVILGGHRRRVACQLAGLEWVPVRVYPIVSTSPEFPAVLVDFNSQRVKGVDEIVREEIVMAKPLEAHGRLLHHRRVSAAVGVENIVIRGEKWRCKITAVKQPMMDAVLAALEEYRDFLPVTVRRIHYALLNRPPLRHAGWEDSRYRNDLKSYKDLSDLLTRAREEGLVPWELIHDPTRPVTEWDCHRNTQDFVREQLEWAEVLSKFRKHILGRPDLLALLPDLRGKVLACPCHLSVCHADVLADLIDLDIASIYPAIRDAAAKGVIAAAIKVVEQENQLGPEHEQLHPPAEGDEEDHAPELGVVYDEDDEQPDDGDEEEVVAPPSGPYDEAGVPVPPQALEAFGQVAELRAVCDMLREVARRLDKVRKGPAGVHFESCTFKRFSGKGAAVTISGVGKSLEELRPAFVCPACPEDRLSRCTACYGRGWLTTSAHEQWAAAAAEQADKPQRE
jgi:hypothetical protein